MMNEPGKLRVSVATYNQVVFPHRQSDNLILALERKATVLKDGSVHVRAQPFGGAVRILKPDPLKEMLGEIEFDSERSKQEGDFRIPIQPTQWEEVKQYCLFHLRNSDDLEIESTPDRELVEEFEETLQVELKPTQYKTEPSGFAIEDNPVWTEKWYARAYPTVRIYRTYKVKIVDVVLCEFMLAASQKYSDHDLGELALKDLQNGGTGRVNSILTLPLNTVINAYRTLPPETRFKEIAIEGHRLDESLLAVLDDMDVPQYQRITDNKIGL
jgi:hypothetical protein